MLNGYMIVALCGNLEFEDDFTKAARRLTLQGKLVLNKVFFDPSESDDSMRPTKSSAAMLSKMQMTRIMMADEVYVINRDGDIDDMTKQEIQFAQQNGKPIRYMESNGSVPMQGMSAASSVQIAPDARTVAMQQQRMGMMQQGMEMMSSMGMDSKFH